MTPTVPTELLARVFARAEHRRRRAARAEQVAFDRWQKAYAAHEIACEKASAAWQAYAASIAH